MKKLRSLVALTVAGISSTFAWDISGTFEDKGVAVSSESMDSPTVVSLQALLNLEFNAQLGVATYANATEVQIDPGRSNLDLKILGAEGTLLGDVSWSIENYQATEGGGVMVRIRSPRSADDSYVLLLETINEGQLLQAKVMQVEATTFGPKYQELGTYFFPRAT